MLKRTKGRMPQKNLLQVARAIFISKWEYGISVYGIFLIKEEQPKSKVMNKIQVLQNHMLRMLSLKSMPTIKWGTKKLCEYYGVLSINQTIAKFKLLEFWKVIKNAMNPLNHFVGEENNLSLRNTRFGTQT